MLIKSSDVDYDPATALFMFRDPDSSDEDDPITIKGYSYTDGNPVMNRNPDGKEAWAVANEGFAEYEVTKRIKQAKTKNQLPFWACTYGQLIKLIYTIQ